MIKGDTKTLRTLQEMFKHMMLGILILILFSGLTSCSQETGDTISLAGEWNVKLDSTDVGEKESWAKKLENPKNILLPGTLDDGRPGKTQYS